MIKKVSVSNFKSHAHTEIELGRVTALVGPNGAGKSALLLAIQTLNQLTRQIVERDNRDFSDLIRFLRRGASEIGITIAGFDPQWKIAISTNGQWLATNFEFENEIYKPIVQYEHDDDETGVTLWPVKGNPVQAFGQIAYFKAIAQSVALPSYTLDIPPAIGIDGSDVASVISYLKNSQEETHKLIEDDLRAIVPAIKHVRVHPVPKVVKEKRTISANGNTIAYDEDRKVVAQELIFDTQSGKGLPAPMVSEGTLITLALLSVLHTSEASLFLLDDVEQALHPLAQRKIMGVLKEFAERYNRQIILTSHSPYIADELEAKDIWVMATDKDGVSHCKQLSEHPDIDYALSVLTTGEIWGAEGEEWVLNAHSPVETSNA